MNENDSGLKSNLEKSDDHSISLEEYAEIPELPKVFFTEGQLYQDGNPVNRRLSDKSEV